ncbi:MAG: NAD(P)-dependent alcohol dehydrogenase [Bellilinea sp.]
MSNSAVIGYSARAMGETLERMAYEPPALGELDVRVAITHCGVCYTDIQAIDDYYDITNYPFVPGHEIVGFVTESGSSVTALKAGDRVGIGWQGRSCGKCEWCLKGEEHLCIKIAHAGVWEPYGGFSSSVIVDSRFAYLLPEGMPAETAAVLMCAGITVYSALRRYSTSTRQNLAVVGMGGLGHLAVQFARHMNYDVTVISGSPEKRAEALAYGANDFMVSQPDILEENEFAFDLLLCTIHGDLDPVPLMDTLKKNGRFILVGFPDLSLNTRDLVSHQVSITGSFIGSRAVMREMLDFAQAHKITPKVELMPMSKVNEALQRVKDNKARYRIVLTSDQIQFFPGRS